MERTSRSSWQEDPEDMEEIEVENAGLLRKPSIFKKVRIFTILTLLKVHRPLVHNVPGRLQLPADEMGSESQNQASLKRKKSVRLLTTDDNISSTNPSLRRNNSMLKRNTTLNRNNSVLRRKKSVMRKVTTEPNAKSKYIKSDDVEITWWVIMSRTITFYLPPFLLSAFGMTDMHIQQAFREKIAICTINLFIVAIVGFLSFGTTIFICTTPPTRFRYNQLSVFAGLTAIHGRAYAQEGFTHPSVPQFSFDENTNGVGFDATYLFPNADSSACQAVLSGINPFPCTLIVPTGSLKYFPIFLTTQTFK